MKQLKKFILWLIGLGLVCFIGISNVFGATTKTIYPNTNFSQNANNYLKLNESGTFGITNINTTIQGVSYGFNFYMQENVVLNKTYTIVITFMADDLRSDFQNNYVHVNVGSGSTSSSVAIVSITRNNPTGYSSTLTIKFNPLTTGDYIQVNLISDGPPYQPLTGVSTYGIRSVTLDSSADTQDIINNQNQNTQDIINAQQSSSSLIINSQQSSASSIMENQNQNTQDLIDSQYSCNSTTIDLSKIDSIKNKNLNSSGSIINNNSTMLTNYIRIANNQDYTITFNYAMGNPAYCLYNKDKEKISCSNYNQQQTITFSSGSAEYIRLSYRNDTSVRKSELTGYICLKDSEQQMNAINDLNDSINDDDIGGASQDGADFILDFDTNTFGLTSIVTAPLNLIQSLTSSSCSELELPLPFLNNKKLKLPCMTTIYQNTFGSLFTMYQTITFGIIAYWVCVRIFNQVKDFKNPEHDEIEVVDL